MNEVILAVLQNSLIVETSDSHALSFGLRVLVGVLHLLLSLVHMAGANGLNLLMKRSAQDVLSIFDIHPGASILTFAGHVVPTKI